MKNYEEMTDEEQEKYMDELNKYSEKCKNISSATCWESDRGVADSLHELAKELLDK